MPTTDPAYAVLAGILDLARTSDWHFARISPNGYLVFLDTADEAERKALAEELRRQRLVSNAGPRIAATIFPFPGAVSGVTLIFADVRADFGILALLRDAELEAFTSSEIAMLTFALDAGSDRLSTLRLQPRVDAAPGGTPPVDATPAPEFDDVFYVLDEDLNIFLATTSQRRLGAGLAAENEPALRRLPPLLEESVRELTAAWATSAVKEPGIARPVSFLVVRTQPMEGPPGAFIGVRIDRFLPPNSLTGAATRFHISPREVQVLARLLDGDHLDQIAAQLNITSSTVQDHIKSMLDKTDSRNRSELIARILGWESRANPRVDN